MDSKMYLENKFDTGLTQGMRGLKEITLVGGCITSLIGVPFRAMKYH